MASYIIEINLSGIETNELIEELENRYLNDCQQQDLFKILDFDDARKALFFHKIKDKYSLFELEEKFKEKLDSVIVNERQLELL